MNVRNVFCVLVSLLSHMHLVSGAYRHESWNPLVKKHEKCDSHDNCQDCADNKKCAWCETENDSDTKCQGNMLPCLGEKTSRSQNCKDYCDLSPCKPCLDQVDENGTGTCHWCISDDTCRTKSEDTTCDFGIVDSSYQCYRADESPRDKDKARAQWKRQLMQLNGGGRSHARYYSDFTSWYTSGLNNGYTSACIWWSVGLSSVLAICCFGMICRCCCCKKKNATSNDQPPQSTAMKPNEVFPPSNPNQLKQGHPQQKKGNTKNDGVGIYLSPVMGSDNECFTDELQPNKAPMNQQEGRPESRRP